MSRICQKCREEIPAKRLEALPHTQVCVGCSTERPVKGHTFFEHKTAPGFQIVSAEHHEWLQANKRTTTAARLPMDNKRPL